MINFGQQLKISLVSSQHIMTVSHFNSLQTIGSYLQSSTAKEEIEVNCNNYHENRKHFYSYCWTLHASNYNYVLRIKKKIFKLSFHIVSKLSHKNSLYLLKGVWWLPNHIK